MTFLANPLGFTPAEFKTYVAKLAWTAWRPRFLVLHNTAEPNLRQWTLGNNGKDCERKRIVNLNHYYRNEQGWHSGPHLFISPSLIWVACDLTADGVHASCYNRESLGVEMVGDYGVEAFDSGDGARVRDNAVAALAILYRALAISPDTLHFHKECIRDHHDCPGKHVDKADIVARVTAYHIGDVTKAIAGPGSSGGAGASGSYETPAAPETAAPEPTTPALVEHVEAVKAATAAVAAPQPYNDRAATIYKFWLAAGFTPAQACGLLAQADAESSLNETAVGDHGQAFGLHQWHSSRVEAIREGCGVDLSKAPGLADQLKAALWELQHTEKVALEKIMAARTAYDAGHAAARYWERPGSTAQYARRGDAAEKWATYFARRHA
jgi:hypothetical protein